MLDKFSAAALLLAAIPGFAASPGSLTQAESFHRIVELTRLAAAQENAGNFPRAADFYRQAADQSSATGINPEIRLRLLVDCAEAHEHAGEWTDAGDVLHAALDWAEARFGSVDERTASAHVRLASVEIMLGRVDAADVRLRSALDMQRTAPLCHRSEVTLALTTLAILDLNQQKLAEGEQLASRAIALNEEHNPRAPELGDALGVLAGICVAKGESTRALPLLTRSIDILGRPSINTVRVAPLLVERGVLEAGERKFSLAEEDIERAIRILDSGGAPNVNADWPRIQLAKIYMADDKLDRADAILPDAVVRQRGFLGPGRRLAFYIRELAHLRFLEKQYREAGALYRECLTMVGATPREAGHGSPGDKDIRRLEREAETAFRSTPAG